MVLSALAAAVMGMMASQLVMMFFTFLMAIFAEVTFLADSSALIGTNMFSGLASMLVAWILTAAAPVGIALWSAHEYRSNYRFAAGDLVWNDLALMLMNEQYAELIEQERKSRFRLNANPVVPGDTIQSRLQHFAAYYKQYRLLSRPAGEFKLPMVVERNCWAEGIGLGLSACLSMCCVGLLIGIPLVIRTVSIWPSQLAVKYAVLHFFEGRFDHALEQQYLARSN